MSTSKSSIQNESLFSLSNSATLRVPEGVCIFLRESVYPWNALGKALTDFVKKSVEQVPVGERLRGNISPQATLEGDDIVISEGAIVEAGAYICGPTFIGPGVAVRHCAYVRGSVYACEGSVIGHTSEVKGALLLPKSKAAHFAYVGDSILGCDTNLGAGTKLANLRLDHGIVKILTTEEKISSGLKKFGAILGNEAQTGCNSVANPGAILLPGALVPPGKVVTGIIQGKKA